MRKNLELIDKIIDLKTSLNAVILAHNYQRSEIQEIADYMGDSLVLAQKAMELDNPVIVFCGVHFMAESAKILSPEKKVLLPETRAGCPLADCATADQVREMRQKYPKALFIAYINTSAEVKALSDICVTSANAIDIIKQFPDSDIVYLPDKNLAEYAEYKLNREIIKWPGQCYVHDQRIHIEDIVLLKKKYPDAFVMSHPEARLQVLKNSDLVTGTGGMLKYALSSDKEKFIVATENGLVDRMKREMPDKTFIQLPTAICDQMKLTRLQSLYDSLLYMKTEIQVPLDIAMKARKALNKMMELTA